MSYPVTIATVTANYFFYVDLDALYNIHGMCSKYVFKVIT